MIEKKPSEEELGKMVGKEKLNVNEQEENKDKIGEKNSFEEIKKWAKKEVEKVINLDIRNLTYDERINRYDVWDKTKEKIILTIYFYDMRHRRVLPKIFLVNPSQNLKEQHKNKLSFKTKWKSANGQLDESYEWIINDKFEEASKLLFEFIEENKEKCK